MPDDTVNTSPPWASISLPPHGGPITLWELASALWPRWALAWRLAGSCRSSHVREVARVIRTIAANRPGAPLDWDGPWSPEMVRLFEAGRCQRADRIGRLRDSIFRLRLEPRLRGAMVSEAFVTRAANRSGALVEVPRSIVRQAVVDLEQGTLSTPNRAITWHAVTVEWSSVTVTDATALQDDGSPESTPRSSPPPEFTTWAESQHEANAKITFGAAKSAMAGLSPPPGRNELRRWIGTLCADWVASRGSPPRN